MVHHIYTCPVACTTPPLAQWSWSDIDGLTGRYCCQFNSLKVLPIFKFNVWILVPAADKIRPADHLLLTMRQRNLYAWLSCFKTVYTICVLFQDCVHHLCPVPRLCTPFMSCFKAVYTICVLFQDCVHHLCPVPRVCTPFVSCSKSVYTICVLFQDCVHHLCPVSRLCTPFVSCSKTVYTICVLFQDCVHHLCPVPRLYTISWFVSYFKTAYTMCPVPRLCTPYSDHTSYQGPHLGR